jgi:hypothetical protein
MTGSFSRSVNFSTLTLLSSSVLSFRIYYNYRAKLIVFDYEKYEKL